MKSNWMKSMWLLTLAAAVLLTSAAFAETVVVTPDNMGLMGWASATYNGASASFRDVSIQIPYEFNGNKWASPAGGPLPYGAFYGYCGEEGSTETSPYPGQVWLGTNQFTGRYIKDITKLEYSTWTLAAGCGYEAGSYHWAKQPFQIQIAIRKTGPTDPNWRYLMHRPWGTMTFPEGLDGGNPYNTWDASQGVWYEAWSGLKWDSWAAVQAAYPNGYIDTPALNANDMFPYSGLPVGDPNRSNIPGTGTGYSVNLVSGARKQIMNIFGYSGYAWWRESMRFTGCVDNFTIGLRSIPLDPTSTPIETTYDFEPFEKQAIERTVVISNRDAKARVNRSAKFHTKYVVVGYVQAPDADYVVGSTFKIGDCNTAGGALAPGYVVKVICPGHTNMPGELVRVEGMIDEITTPAILMTKPEFVTPIYP